jgi:hypothetical protein
MNRVIGIYTLLGVKGKSSVSVKHLETFKYSPDLKLKDTSIHRYDIDKHIYGEIFACNIPHTYLMKSKKQPLLYVNIYMAKPLINPALLYRVYVYFNIEDNINSEKEFLSRPLNGYFSMEVEIDNKSRVLENKIEEYPGKEEIRDIMVNFTTTNEMKMLLNELKEEAERKISDKYKHMWDNNTIPKNIISLKNYKFDNN